MDRQSGDRYGEESICTPLQYINHYLAENGLQAADIQVSPTVLLTWTQYAADAFRSVCNGQLARHWFYDGGHVEHPMYHGFIGERPVSVAVAPEGAPATIVMMEEMIACGAERFIGLGWAGSIDPMLKVGDVLVATRAFSEEGTSEHYVRRGVPLVASQCLLDTFTKSFMNEELKLVFGGVLSTDAPYRELVSTVVRMRSLGASAIDMETSAMYALGCFRRIDVCNLLCISDSLHSGWLPAFRSSAVRRSTERLAEAIASVLKRG